MVAEPRDFNAIFLGSLEDGEVVIDLVGLVVDEDLNLLSGEETQGLTASQQLTQHLYYRDVSPKTT